MFPLQFLLQPNVYVKFPLFVEIVLTSPDFPYIFVFGFWALLLIVLISCFFFVPQNKLPFYLCSTANAIASWHFTSLTCGLPVSHVGKRALHVTSMISKVCVGFASFIFLRGGPKIVEIRIDRRLTIFECFFFVWCSFHLIFSKNETHFRKWDIFTLNFPYLFRAWFCEGYLSGLICESALKISHFLDLFCLFVRLEELFSS